MGMNFSMDENNPRTESMNIIEDLIGEQCVEDFLVNARGFRGGVNVLNYVFPVIMLQLIAMFVVSRAIHLLLRPLKQPKFVTHVLAGILLGPSVLGHIEKFKAKMVTHKDYSVLYMIANMGIYYLVFILSVKMDVTTILKSSGKRVWIIGASSLLLPLFTTLFLMFLNYHFDISREDDESKLHILKGCLLLSATAFPQVANSLDEMNLISSEIGHLAMSCAVVNDIIRVFAILLISLVVLFRKIGAMAIVSISSFMVGIYFLRMLPLWINRNTPEGKAVKEVYVVGMLAGVLIAATISQMVLGSPAIGVMIFGLIVPDGPSLGAALVAKTEVLLSGFFMPAFFVEIGLNVEVNRGLFRDHWRLFLAYNVFVCVIFVAKLLGSFIPASLVYKMSHQNALVLGLVMNFKGVVEASGFTYWRYGGGKRKAMDDSNYVALIFAITVITAIITPVISALHNPEDRLFKATKRPVTRAIQDSKETGQSRVLLCIHDPESVGSVLTLLEASNPTNDSPINAFMVHLIELVGRDAPLLAPYTKRGSTRKSSKTAQMVKAFENYAEYATGRFAVLPFTLVAPFKSMHELICRFAEDKLTSLIILPFDSNNTAPLQNLTTNLQKNAPCTVGILVNRSSSDLVRYEHFSYQVAVVFLGGVDDREALAYGIRMSGHPNLSITVLRIHFTEVADDYRAERKVERQFDDKLVDEFKRKNVNNACALYRGEVVEDIVHAINVIKSLGNGYDLVMVGRRRSTNMGVDWEADDDWSENPELGLIGDVIASPEYFGGMVSVLVMQHYGDIDDWKNKS